MRKPTFTILVAVYNAERYLRECLDSLARQTLRELQIVCIDDASTDSSLAILREYAAQDPRIEVVSLTRNGGQATARNVGLATARGTYTCFLDSDDYVEADALEKVRDVFRSDEAIDSVLFRVIYVYPDGCRRNFRMAPFRTMSGMEALEKSLAWKIHGIYAVRTELHKRYPYDDACRFYSDDNTTCLHYLHSRKVALSDGVYCYRQHSASCTHRTDLTRLDALGAAASLKRQLRNEAADARILAKCETRYWLVVIDTYHFYVQSRRRLTPAERAAVLGEIRSHWAVIETPLIERRHRWKLGYMPMRFSWRAFVLQEEIYFGLRNLIR